MALILDTGVLFAALDINDPDHSACRDLIEMASEEVIIPAPILGEVDYFISRELYPGVLLALLRDIRVGNFRVVELVAEDYTRIEEIVSQYRDSDVGFVDAAVLALVERFNEARVATIDTKHFAMMRPRHVDALTLLPESGR
jgi:uncharacterized protein